MNYTLRNLLVAALLMLLGIVAVTSFIRGERKELSQGKQEVQVYVASKDIPAGTPASELESGGFLEVTDMLKEDVPPNAIDGLGSIKGLVSNENVYRGEVVGYQAFDKTTGLAPSNQIKGNERLFSVPMNPAFDVGGLIRAGDHVDIVASIKDKDSGQPILYMAARDVEVIQTPESLTPETVEVEAAAPEAEGDIRLYVLKATDREQAFISFAMANDVDNKLAFTLRPANGDAESEIPPIVGAYEPPKGKPVASQFGPDPAVN